MGVQAPKPTPAIIHQLSRGGNKIARDLAEAASGFTRAGSAPAPRRTRDACSAKAVDKNGKALAGAAKKSFMDKCEKGA
jgi:hypothetical protein